MGRVLHLECPECNRQLPAGQIQTVCASCQAPLFARYDLAGLAQCLAPAELRRRPSGLWRWTELLPVEDDRYRLTLGEGDTPLLWVPRLAAALGLERVYLKDEGVNPTGSFKARGMSVALSRAAELGIREVVVPSAGNAGGAMAAYAARAGLRAHVILPADAHPAFRLEAGRAGAEVVTVDGLIDRAGQEAERIAVELGAFNMATLREPYRVEGKKTMGYEIAEAFGWELPEAIVYPAGGGTGLVGLAKAFEELEGLGWIGSRRPRLYAVQAAGCAPVVRAIQTGAERIEAWPDACTRAEGLRVPRPYADRAVLRAVRQSRGTAIAVGEDELSEAVTEVARLEGVLMCLEGGAAVAGLRRLAQAGAVRPEERVVVFNTAAGWKGMG
jgi:threonine synthase